MVRRRLQTFMLRSLLAGKKVIVKRQVNEWEEAEKESMDNEDEVQKELNDEGTEIEEDTQPCAYTQQKENRCTQ